jgi:hypothetical protein
VLAIPAAPANSSGRAGGSTRIHVPRIGTEEVTMKSILNLAGALLLVPGAAIAAETLIPVPPVPGSVATTVFAINDNNVVAGSYTTPDGIEHGFFGTLEGTYTTFDSSFANTHARGINNSGAVTGITFEKKKSLPFERYADGTIVNLTKNGKPLGFGIAGAINNHGTFVADGYNRKFTKYFSFYGEDAEYRKALAPPGLSMAAPRGINDSNDAAGYYRDGQGGMHGFLFKDGTATTIDYPGSIGTLVYGVNNADKVVGFWGDQTQKPHAFIYDPASGQFTAIVEKRAKHGQYAVAYGLNNDGLVAVNFVFAGGPFIYCPHKPSQCPSGARPKSVVSAIQR